MQDYLGAMVRCVARRGGCWMVFLRKWGGMGCGARVVGVAGLLAIRAMAVSYMGRWVGEMDWFDGVAFLGWRCYYSGRLAHLNLENQISLGFH